MKEKFFMMVFAIFAEFISFCLYAQTACVIPQGFAEKQLPFTRAHICYPKDWYLTHNNLEKEKKYFVSFSRENPYSSPVIRTALSIITFGETQKKFGKLPSEYAREFIENLKKKTNIVKEWEEEKDGIIKYGFIREDTAEEMAEEIKEHFVAICNDKTNTLYMLSFVAPAQSWEQDWEIGKLMIQSFQIDQTF